MKTLIALAGSLVAVGTASAAFLQAEIQTPDNYTWQYGDFSVENKITATIYLAGLDAGTSLIAVFGDVDNPMTISTEDPGGFYNASELGQLNGPPNPALFSAFPSLQWDSWGDIQMSPDLSFSPGFPNVYAAGGGDNVIDNNDLAWFDGDPGTPEMEVDGRIRIAQLTWTYAAQPDYDATFKVSVQYGDASQERYVEFEGGGFSVLGVPSPGALALLGLAGLIGRRRR
jgi:MYXO-CTERM domain-containing protein